MLTARNWPIVRVLLSVVFLMIFTCFGVPGKIHWVPQLFGIFLIAAGIKMWWVAGQEPDRESNPAFNGIVNLKADDDLLRQADERDAELARGASAAGCTACRRRSRMPRRPPDSRPPTGAHC